jgi:hypothetical protein
VERSRATASLAQGVEGLVGAINGKRMETVALLLPEAVAGDLGRRERFVRLVREFGPQATLVSVGEPTLNEDRGEANFEVNFSWRGDFGVSRRKSGRFLGLVRRDDSGWRFVGARLLTAVP